MKKLKKVICIALSIVIGVTTVAFASNVDTESSETMEGPSELMVIGESDGLPAASPFASPTKKFVDHPNWHEISDAESTALFKENKPFIVMYYKTTCGISQTRAKWAKQWLNEYDITIYGVMLADENNKSVYGWPGWSNLGIPRNEVPEGQSGYPYPFITFVTNKDDYVTRTGWTARPALETHLRKVVAALSPDGKEPTTWNGKNNVQSGQHLIVDKDIIVEGSSVIIEKGATVTINDGVTVTVDSAILSVQGDLLGNGRVVAIGSYGVVAGLGKQQNVFYNISVKGGTSDKYLARTGESFTLTPSPSSKVFDGWIIRTNVGNSSSKKKTFTVGTSSVNVEVVYKPAIPVEETSRLFIQFVLGGSVDLSSGTDYKPGESITLTATPADGYKFKEWKFDPSNVTTAQNKQLNPVTVKMPSTQLVVDPVFVLDNTAPTVTSYPLTINTSNSGKTNIASGNKHLPGAKISINAIPASGYQFKEWQVTGVTGVNKTTNPLAFTMPSGAVSVTPIFEQSATQPGASTPQLTVANVFGGTTNAADGEYAAGANIKLTAAPSTGYKFQEWRIVGLTSSVSRDNPFSFKMPAKDVSIIPIFVTQNAPNPAPIDPTDPVKPVDPTNPVDPSDPTGVAPLDPESLYPTNPVNSLTTGTSSSSGTKGSTVGGVNSGSGGSSNSGSKAVSAQSSEKLTAKTASELAQNAINNAANKDKVIVSVTGKSEIEGSVLQTIREIEKTNGARLSINADQVQDRMVRIRLTFSPSDIPSGQSIQVGDSTSRAELLQKRFSAYFKNEFTVLSLNQEGGFGALVKVSMRLPKEISSENIVVYSYNSTTNTYVIINDPKVTVDAKGYLIFNTNVGGDFIISDGELIK